MRNSGADPVRPFADPLRPRILVIGVDWLGDALFMTPVFRAVKTHWPSSFVAVTTASRNRSVLGRCRHVDSVRPYDEVPFLLGLPEQHRLKTWIASNHFDAALFLHRSFTRALAVHRAGVPRRIGWSGTRRDALLTERIPPPASSLHRIDRYLSILSPLNVPVSGRHPEIEVRSEDVSEWQTAVRQHSAWDPSAPYVVVHPGGNWDLKRWPIEPFGRMARRFADAGINVAVCGSSHEAGLGAAVEAAGGPRPGRIVSFCGKTSFGALAGMLAGARLMLSNDSGPLHLAAALGTRVVGLFGPTLPELTGPVTRTDSRCVTKDFGCELPCYFDRCRNRVCMERLGEDEVAAAVNGLLEGTARI